MTFDQAEHAFQNLYGLRMRNLGPTGVFSFSGRPVTASLVLFGWGTQTRGDILYSDGVLETTQKDG